MDQLLLLMLNHLNVTAVETDDGYEAFANFLQTEFSMENILFVTEVGGLYMISMISHIFPLNHMVLV